MLVAITLHTLSTLSLCVQLCIFLYLYFANPERVRFFRYVIWAWGCFVLVKSAELAHELFPGSAGSTALMHAAGSAGVLLVLAGGLAYRNAYRMRWPHASVGLALALLLALWQPPAAEGMAALPWREIVCGGLLIAGGLTFWPRRAPRTSPLGGDSWPSRLPSGGYTA